MTAKEVAMQEIAKVSKHPTNEQVRELNYQIWTHLVVNQNDFKKQRRTIAGRKRWITQEEYNAALENLAYHEECARIYAERIREIDPTAKIKPSLF